jgi:CheY-like chemotaxis protein
MSPKHILVIDDEDDIREVAVLSLETGGDFTVSTANGGRKGIDRACAERPDLILLDVMMPELDGPATLALLRQNELTRDIPVVFLTAKVQSADKRRLSALGALGLLPKPFDPLTLGDELAALAEWS